jgi:cyclopropane-fatty-acyl-phospholipid synthase
MKANIVPVDNAAVRISAARLRAADPYDNSVPRMTRLARHLLLSQLAPLEHGELTIIADGVRRSFGRRTAVCDLSATIEVVDSRFWTDTAFGGSVGAGESYINGYWRCSDLTALVRIMVVNGELQSGLEGGWAAISAPVRRVLHFMSRNSKSGSRRNIAAHYDLGNDLFGLFLDSTMAYSCGVFERPEATMQEASEAKFGRICRKLDLRPEDHVLEIGTGWGGFAIHAVREYGCRVTTTTISREQFALAKEKVAAAGLSDRIQLLLEDYRDLHGSFDKIVSIEMVEAVGHAYLDTYFEKCSELLKPDGMMALQAITIRDQLYKSALRSVDFIQRFIFPGSFIPCASALATSIGRATDLKVFNLEDIGPHYATTLHKWREAFFAKLPEVKALGYPDAFVRMWEYYLCYCEGGFAERQLGTVQLILTKPLCRRKPLA